MDNIVKAYAMSNAKISFVSLVNKAANKKQFIITKAEDGTASFQTYGKILKADPESHYVFGIVYEPMTEDTQGNYMTEEEIAKAAYWFAENQGSVDLQHSFEALEGATVVESYIAKCDEEIEGQAIKKGTWLMTVKITDPEIFDDIKKGDITGFSMGGVGTYSEEDVDISKSEGLVEAEPETAEKEGILRKLAKWIGISDKPDKMVKSNISEKPGEIEKAGKAMSKKNFDTLKTIHESLGSFISNFEESEELDVTNEELKEVVKSAVAEAVAQVQAQAPVEKQEEKPEPKEETITKADIQKMIDEAILKAVTEGVEDPQEEPQEETVEEQVEKAVAKALEPFMKQEGLPTNLNAMEGVKKSADEHYLHGLL